VLTDASRFDPSTACIRPGERLPALVGGRDLLRAIRIPGTAVDWRPYTAGIETIVRAQLDFVHRLSLELRRCLRRGNRPAAVTLRGVGSSDGRELLDIHDGRCASRCGRSTSNAVDVPSGEVSAASPYFGARLVAGHPAVEWSKWWRPAGEIGNRGFALIACQPDPASRGADAPPRQWMEWMSWCPFRNSQTPAAAL